MGCFCGEFLPFGDKNIWKYLLNNVNLTDLALKMKKLQNKPLGIYRVH
jgi:hypothetical protein